MNKLSKILNLIQELVIDVTNYKEGLLVKGIGGLDSNEPMTLGWIASYKKNKQELIKNTTVNYLITDYTIDTNNIPPNKIIIRTINPRLAFIMVAERFYNSQYIRIEKRIGHDCIISNTAIIKNAQIGDRCIIQDHVVIYDGVIIGNDTIIQSGTIIGNTGLGCERDMEGALHKFPHYSNVIIGNKVDIGPNCQIVRGTLGPTIIGDGNKIDGLCSIGHNSIIGSHNWIASSVTIAGSVIIGDYCTIYASSSIKDQIDIGDSCVIGMGAVVTKNIPSKEMWYGCPAIKIKDL